MAPKRSKIAVGLDCPNPLHKGSTVVAKGTRQGKSGVRQRLECRPVGYPAHQFSVLVSAGGESMPLYSPAPECVRHAGSKVIRIGSYGSGATKRQRYRCTPTDDAQHDFTPDLPREHVHAGTDRCSVCDELRGIHRGDRSASRRSTWSAQEVAAVLAEVASGASYGKASRDARARTGRTMSHPNARKVRNPSERVSAGRLESHRYWHTAADFVEVYAPTLWEYEESLLRERDKAMMVNAASASNRPTVLVLDSIPVYGKRVRNATKQEWQVLAAAQVVYGDGTRVDKSTVLRLVRAFPTADAIAWKLFLSELAPYEPQFVVSDYDYSQLNALAQTWPNATFIPSLYQMRTNIENSMLAAPNAWEMRDKVRRPVPTLRAHLKLLRAANLAKMTADKWTRWWDSLIAEMEALNAPTETVVAQRRNYEQHYATLINVFKTHPDITLSTGGLELLLAERIKPLLARRKHAFANIERTNNLYDLVVCHNAGLFHDKALVVDLLRRNNEEFYGWSRELRVVADVHPEAPGQAKNAVAVIGAPTRTRRVRYSSLRDTSTLRALAEKKGLVS